MPTGERAWRLRTGSRSRTRPPARRSRRCRNSEHSRSASWRRRPRPSRHGPRPGSSGAPTLRETDQLDNTLIVFVSDNGWLQGEHRIGGDKFLRYEESLRIPFTLRGPGIRAGRTIKGQVSNIDFAPTLLDAARAKPGRKLDGLSLLPTVRDPGRRPDRALEIEALAPLFEADDIPINAWDRPYSGVRTDRYTFVVWTETSEHELYDRRRDPAQLDNVAGQPGYAGIEARLGAKLGDCEGRSCDVRP